MKYYIKDNTLLLYYIDGDRFIDCNTKAWTLILDKPKSYGDFRRMYFPEVWLRKVKGFVLSLFYKDN